MHSTHLLLEEPIRMATILEPSKPSFFTPPALRGPLRRWQRQGVSPEVPSLLTGGGLGWAVEKRTVRRSVVCEAAPVKKADSAAKRSRQAENRRVYNKSKKSEIKTQMRKLCGDTIAAFGFTARMLCVVWLDADTTIVQFCNTSFTTQ